MRNKYLTFIILISLILYILYSIINYKYREYKINNNIKNIEKLNKEIKKQIEIWKEIIEYKKSTAYKNKILKQDHKYKNKWEKVIYLATEDKYNKYTQKEKKEHTIDLNTDKDNDITNNMTNYQKWIYYLFKKDIRQ